MKTINKYKEQMTSITIFKSTKEKLKNIGKKGETYDAIVLRLIETIENQLR